MKVARITLFALLAALLAVGVSTTSYAFHSGGVAECGGCHSMHTAKAGGTFLLVGADQSSTCLTCHEEKTDTGPSSYHIATQSSKLGPGASPLERTPGGDFGWLKKTYTFVQRGSTVTFDGATFGHDITAVDFGYTGRSNNPTTSPGGTFPTAQLACNSCHDPHGQYRRLQSGAIAKSGAPIKASGSYDNTTTNEPTATEAVGVYRLLAGAGYTKGGVTFNGVPAAKVPGTYNRTEAVNDTRVAYGVATTNGHETWGQWCGTCHGDMHSSGNYVHPVDQGLGSTIAGLYNQYVKSGDMTGTSTSSFTSLVPFATNSGDYAALAALAKNNGSAIAGPGSSDQVMCLSCHRAHATAFPEMLRWNMEGEFLTTGGLYAGSTGTSGGRTEAEYVAAYYDRPATKFATYQRGLCNKCHAKD
jgi:predicted CXXCH cytochrome family protein